MYNSSTLCIIQWYCDRVIQCGVIVNVCCGSGNSMWCVIVVCCVVPKCFG